MPLYVVLTGKRASGKDHFVAYSEKKYNIPSIRFSSVLGELGVKHGLIKQFTIKEKSKLQYLGNYFRQHYGEEYYVEEIAKRIKGRTYIINGTRALKEPPFLEKYLEDKVLLVGITASDQIRYERAVKSGLVKNRKEFKILESNKADAPITDLIKMASVQIENNGTKEEFEKKIDEFWTRYLKK